MLACLLMTDKLLFEYFPPPPSSEDIFVPAPLKICFGLDGYGEWKLCEQRDNAKWTAASPLVGEE